MQDERKRRESEPRAIAAARNGRGGKLFSAACAALLAAIVLIAIVLFGTGCAAKKERVIIHSIEGETTSQLPAGGTRTVADVVEDVADTVVEIKCKVVTYVNTPWGQLRQEGTSSGSGVILDANGYIITNHHVIESATDISVRLHNGADYETCDAVLIASDADNDIAVIKVEKEGLSFATFGDSSALKAGQPVVVIGNPLGTLGGTVTDGILSALGREITIDGTTMTLLQTNAAINQGNSGGGMFDLDGRLIGIVNAKSSGTGIEGLGFAIPANTAKEVYERLLAA